MRVKNWLLAGTSVAVLALAPLPALAQDTGALINAYDAYMQAQASGDADAISAAQAALETVCTDNGYASLAECLDAIAVMAPPAEPAPMEEPAPAVEEPAPAAEEAAPAADTSAQFMADLQAALDRYQAALDQATNGDYEGGLAAATAARADIQALCDANGYADIVACVGQDLPPLPAPPAEPMAPAAEPAPAPADTAPQDVAPTDQPAAEPAAEAPAEPAPAPQPTAEEQAATALNNAFEVYKVGISQLEAGDAAGQSTLDAANTQFSEICATLGLTDITECLNRYGITLPPVPALQPAAEPAGPALSDLPAAAQEVTPQAVEVLPEAIAPEEAAPVLDSTKDLTRATDQGVAPPPPAPEAPVAPPPATDEAAQQQIQRMEPVSVDAAQGEALAQQALPPIVVPQNVTVINNVTNVTNVTNISTITNTVNNNLQQPAQMPQPGAAPQPGQPESNYTNSGFIFKIGINLIISNPAQDFDRITDGDQDRVYYERLSNGRIKETVVRPSGIRIVTIRNRWGEVLQRSRILPNGREYILASYDDQGDTEDDFFNWRDPGEDLPPLRLTISIRDYILDADRADEDQVERFMRKPPVEQVRRIYTIDDVKRSARLRDSLPRIEVGGLTFDSGASTIPRSQIGALSKVATAMLSMLEDNPAETFLIEGHTDAVGSDAANLVLSDARAGTVARILTDFYGVPPENLVTQGYGERYLKVKTEAAERLNRRVSIKRITPLVTMAR